MKFVWPAITNAMAERQQQIADGLESADRASKNLELAQEEASKKLKEAKMQASTIIESANKRANQIIDEAKEQAQVESNRIKKASEADVEKQVTQAKVQLRQQFSGLVIQGVEKVINETVDASKHEAMLNQIVEGL